MKSPVFIEVGHTHICKNGQSVCGDSFVCKRVKSEGRLVATLADGLGSGIKASVLSLLTSTMVARCVSNDLDIKETARTTMETLPVCHVRRIGYSTFTIIDIDMYGQTSVIEFDNPNLLWIRHGELMQLQRQRESIETADGRKLELRFSSFTLEAEDRLIVFSDGVSQAGMGRDHYPLGWTQKGVEAFCLQKHGTPQEPSAQEFTDSLANAAKTIDSGIPKDDISAAVIYLRNPRKLLVVTGPPFDHRRDPEIAELCTTFAGKKVICGGTTGSIIARELGRPITIDMSGDMSEVPPGSHISGIDMVTEGTITLSCLCQYLENTEAWVNKNDAAAALCRLLIASDDIAFLVGTRINEAHQDPSLPVDLDIRRNTIRRICKLLEEKHFKTTTIRFL